MRRAVAALAILVTATAAFAVTMLPGDEIRAKTVTAGMFTLVDEASGVAVGDFASAQGTATLSLWDRGGGMTLEVTAGRNKKPELIPAGISIKDSAHATRFSLSAGPRPEDSIILELTDPFRKETGKHPAGVSLHLAEHRPGIHLYDADGKETARLPPLPK